MRHETTIRHFIVLLFISLFVAYNLACAQHASLSAARFEIVKYNNPDAVVDLGVGLWAQPLPMDYDHDGKTDLLVNCSGTPYNGIYFFKNISGGLFPRFAAPVRLSAGLNNLQISYVDGKPELMIPGEVIKNFPVSFGRERAKLFPVDSILRYIKRVRANQWRLADYDGDGDLDMLVGVGDWGDYGWDNAYNSRGEWTNGPLHGYVFLIKNEQGHYVNAGKLTTADGQPIDVYGSPSPNLADFDGDGDLDLICGEFLDKFTWFENIGTRQHPVYQKGRALANDKGIIKMPLEMINPVAFDWDGDGHVDLIVGQEDGRVALLRNTGRLKNHMPVFKDPVFFRQQAGDLKFGVLSTPYSADWDNDGREDIICGNSAGNIALIRNLGGYPPKWAPPKLLEVDGRPIRIMAGKNGSIQGPAEAKWGYTTLSVADWDGDGLKDLMVNSIWGSVIWFKNTGNRKSPKLSGPYPVKIEGDGRMLKPEWNWWNPGENALVTEWRTTPYAIDWNKDGLMDLIMLDQEGYLSFFERVRKNGQLILQPGKRIFYGQPYSGFNTNNKVTDSLPGLLRLNTRKYGSSGRRKFCMADWDGDGKIDLLVNSLNVSLMKNTGMKGDTIIYSDQGPLTGDKLAGHTTSPAIVDWDKDGIPDLLVGAEDGHFYYMRNPLHQ
jgi:hypothetical protein